MLLTFVYRLTLYWSCLNPAEVGTAGFILNFPGMSLNVEHSDKVCSNLPNVGTARFILDFFRMSLNVEHRDEVRTFGLRISLGIRDISVVITD